MIYKTGHIIKTSVILLGLFFVFMMAKLTVTYLSFKYDTGFLLTKQSLIGNKIWIMSFYLHITTSLIVLFSGIIQNITFVQRSYPTVHRVTGRIYVFLILLVSAPSGLIMALYASGGFWAKLAFVLMAILWWLFTLKGMQMALKMNINRHRAFMYRSFGLTASAITLRLYAYLLPAFSHIHHLHGKDMYVFIAWLSWIPNLLIAEYLIRKNSIRNVT